MTDSPHSLRDDMLASLDEWDDMDAIERMEQDPAYWVELARRLFEQLEAQERELVAARIDLASARDMCARPAGVCFPASRPRPKFPLFESGRSDISNQESKP